MSGLAGRKLPWAPATVPLMLAPMQGLTNRALRAWFCERVRPDVVFTEFVRVRSRGGVSRSDRREIVPPPAGVPLVVQLIGHDPEGLAAAAREAGRAGAAHLNLNLGCPYGRMSSGPTGGGLLARPERLPDLLEALRDASDGGLSVKVRAGYEDPRQIFGLLGLFEEKGVDFLILHPRTVVQQYRGAADHRLTAEVVRATSLPVIANGDLTDAARGHRILAETGAAGLMLGRGAIGDPGLFLRLRGLVGREPGALQRGVGFESYLAELAERYRVLFCGEAQALARLKEVLAFVGDPGRGEMVRDLRRCRTLASFRARLAGGGGEGSGRHLAGGVQ